MLIQKEPEDNEAIEIQGYEGITMVMDYLDDIVIKMIKAGADYSKLIARLANDYCTLRNRILTKAAEEGIDVFPREPEEQIEGQTEITLEPSGSYSFKVSDPEEGGQTE